jgi:hypothetical protein
MMSLGLVVGTILGFTGAGVAILAVPLLIIPLNLWFVALAPVASVAAAVSAGVLGVASRLRAISSRNGLGSNRWRGHAAIFSNEPVTYGTFTDQSMKATNATESLLLCK